MPQSERMLLQYKGVKSLKVSCFFLRKNKSDARAPWIDFAGNKK